MKKVGIIGYGYVGKAFADFFKNHYDTYVYDVNESMLLSTLAPRLNVATKENINACDLAVVCVPTPYGSNGECNLTAIYDTFEWLDAPLILLKSTIEIGTTDTLIDKYKKRIVFSPEYVGESTYFTPYPYNFHKSVERTPWFTFGGNKKDTSDMINFFLPITGPVKTYVQSTAKEAEIAKYMENSFYATKIMFCYEMEQICNASNVDYNTVRELWLQDNRINKMHTAVFTDKTHDDPRCFGGKCLPKDISALVEYAKKMGYSPNLLNEVQLSNYRIGNLLADRNLK